MIHNFILLEGRWTSFIELKLKYWNLNNIHHTIFFPTDPLFHKKELVKHFFVCKVYMSGYRELLSLDIVQILVEWAIFT